MDWWPCDWPMTIKYQKRETGVFLFPFWISPAINLFSVFTISWTQLLCNRRAARNFDNDPTIGVKVQGRAGSAVSGWFQPQSVFANIFDQLAILSHNPPCKSRRGKSPAQDRMTTMHHQLLQLYKLEPAWSLVHPCLAPLCFVIAMTLTIGQNRTEYVVGSHCTAAIMPPHTGTG